MLYAKPCIQSVTKLRQTFKNYACEMWLNDNDIPAWRCLKYRSYQCPRSVFIVCVAKKDISVRYSAHLASSSPNFVDSGLQRRFPFFLRCVNRAPARVVDWAWSLFIRWAIEEVQIVLSTFQSEWFYSGNGRAANWERVWALIQRLHLSFIHN